MSRQILDGIYIAFGPLIRNQHRLYMGIYEQRDEFCKELALYMSIRKTLHTPPIKGRYTYVNRNGLWKFGVVPEEAVYIP